MDARLEWWLTINRLRTLIGCDRNVLQLICQYLPPPAPPAPENHELPNLPSNVVWWKDELFIVSTRWTEHCCQYCYRRTLDPEVDFCLFDVVGCAAAHKRYYHII